MLIGRISFRRSDRAIGQPGPTPSYTKNHLTRPDPARPVSFPIPPDQTRLDPRSLEILPDATLGPGHDPWNALEYIFTPRVLRVKGYTLLRRCCSRFVRLTSMSCHSNRVDTDGGNRRQGRRLGRDLKLSYLSILEHASSRAACSGTPSKNLCERWASRRTW